MCTITLTTLGTFHPRVQHYGKCKKKASNGVLNPNLFLPFVLLLRPENTDLFGQIGRHIPVNRTTYSGK